MFMILTKYLPVNDTVTLVKINYQKLHQILNNILNFYFYLYIKLYLYSNTNIDVFHANMCLKYCIQLSQNSQIRFRYVLLAKLYGVWDSTYPNPKQHVRGNLFLMLFLFFVCIIVVCDSSLLHGQENIVWKPICLGRNLKYLYGILLLLKLRGKNSLFMLSCTLAILHLLLS